MTGTKDVRVVVHKGLAPNIDASGVIKMTQAGHFLGVMLSVPGRVEAMDELLENIIELANLNTPLFIGVVAANVNEVLPLQVEYIHEAVNWAGKIFDLGGS